MGRFNDTLVQAGVLLAADGLHPSAKGARLRFGPQSSSWQPSPPVQKGMGPPEYKPVWPVCQMSTRAPAIGRHIASTTRNTRRIGKPG